MLIVAVTLVIAAGLLWSLTPLKGQAFEDWEILQIAVEYDVRPDGTVAAVERIEVDFRELPSRGIFRELLERERCPEPDPVYPRIYECPDGHNRHWDYDISSIRYVDGSPVPWETSSEGGVKFIRIGDPDVFLTGRHGYQIEYTIEGALDAYRDTDEFFWNAVGSWPVRVRNASVEVTLPEPVPATAACFQGVPGFEQDCPASISTTADSTRITYRSLGMLEAAQAMTIAVEWDKGIVDVPPPITSRPFSVHNLYTFDRIEWIGAAVVAVLGIAGLGRTWWRFGRDRRYTTIHYLTENPEQETRPLFQRHPIVVEYTPPMDLRPGQMGVLQDERADTVDVTATIVDLAVRGYIKIEEIPKSGWFGRTDWKLHRLEEENGSLLPYESRLLGALFQGRGSEVQLSELSQKFATRLKTVQDLMYKDATERGWFASNPRKVTALWGAIGVGVTVIGVGLAAATGYFFERVLIGAPIAVAGLLLLGIASHMSRRTPDGSEARRRVVGFKLYVETAEKHLHEFHEQENIFARYLPYAIVFGCVDKWAKAFEGLDDLERNARRSVSPWYVGAGAFNMRNFNRSLSGFSSNVSSSLSSKPSSSGGSGVRGGGGVGRGGGGGGGGRW